MTTRDEYDQAIKTINAYKLLVKNEYKELQNNNISTDTKKTSLRKANISVRLWNILRYEGEKLGIDVRSDTIEALKNASISDLKRCRGFGTAAENEFKEICFHSGVIIKP